MDIQWQDTTKTLPVLYFGDLDCNDAFRIVGSHAIYIKLEDRTRCSLDQVSHEYMYEIFTGHIYLPTHSPIERVEVHIDINLPKPHLYKNSNSLASK